MLKGCNTYDIFVNFKARTFESVEQEYMRTSTSIVQETLLESLEKVQEPVCGEYQTDWKLFKNCDK